MRRSMIGAGLLMLAAAAGAAAQTPDTAAPQDRAGAQIPSGYGTLRQDQITVRIQSGRLLIKVTPLDEGVIRLAAPDTYGRLHSLAASRMEPAAQRAGVAEPKLFMVSFFSYDPDIPFTPEDLQLQQQGRTLRPLAIIPVTPGWGKQRLDQQETELAIYAFEPSLDLAQPMAVRYGMDRSDAWTGIIPMLVAERAKVLARAHVQ